MTARVFFLVAIFTPLLWRGEEAFCQDSVTAPKKYQQTIEFSAYGNLNSTSLPNDFTRAYYNGEFINDDLKFIAEQKLEASNLLGGFAKVGFTYTSRSLEGRKEPTFSFSFFDRTNLDLKFSDDLFNIVFYGNKNFAGQTADMGGFSHTTLRYQQFRFGWSKAGDHTHGSYGWALSMLSGEQHRFVKMPIGDLFTAEDGTYLDFNVKADVDQTDTTHSGFFAHNGMGLSTDLFYEMPYTIFNRRGILRFDVQDLGLIGWNSNSMHYSVDSTFHFEGAEVDDIFNLDSSGWNVDSVIKENSDYRQGKYTTWIPGSLDVRTKLFYGKQVAIEAGLTWYFNTSAKMYYYGKFHFLFGRQKNMDLAYLLGYGGYGKFNSGIDFTAEIGKHYAFQFTSYYLFSSVAAQNGTGMGYFIKLVRKF